MYFYLRRTEERRIRTQQTLFSPTKGKIHGVWKFNNITPSHLSHRVDTFSDLPSITISSPVYVNNFQTVTYIVVILKPRLISHTKTYIYTVYQNLDAYRIPITRFISQTKTQIYIIYKNLDIHRLPKPRFIQNTNSQICIAYQNLDLNRMLKYRFIQYIKTYIYIACQNLDLYRIPIPRFIPHTKTQIYILY